MNKANLTTARNIATIVGQVMIARTVVARVRQARGDGDRFEFLDAVINVVALVSGTIVMVRRLRAGEEEA